MPNIIALLSQHADRVGIDATLADAAELMLESHISAVIVVDQGLVCGIVTERDMLHAMRLHQAPAMPIRQVMTAPVHTVCADMDFRAAYHEAASLGIRHLVVADAVGHPVGVVTESDFRRHLGLDFFRQLNDVAALMERTFPRLPGTACLDEALATMEAVRASCVLVVEDHQAIGIVTERDIVRLYLGGDDNPPLSRVMTSPVATVHQNTPLAEAAQQMLETGVRHLVVVDEAGKLCGLLTEHSLVRPLEMDLVDDALADRLELAQVRDALLAAELAEKKRAEKGLLLRNAALSGVLRGDPLKSVLECIVHSVEAEMPEWSCSVMLTDESGSRLLVGAAPHLPEGYVQAIDGLAVGDGIGSCGTAAFRRTRVVTENVMEHPFWRPYRKLASSAGFAACWSEPILGPQGELLGTFAAYHAQPTQPAEEDVGRLIQASQLSAVVIAHQRQSSQQQASLDTFRGIFDSVDDALFIQAADGSFLDLNHGVERIFGYPRAALIGQTHAAVGVAGLNDQAAVGRAIAEAVDGTPQCFDYWAQSPAGRVFPVEVRLHPAVYFGRKVLVAAAQDITERRQAALLLGVENDLAQALAAGCPRERILALLLDSLGRFPEFDSAALYWRESSGAFTVHSENGFSPAESGQLFAALRQSPLFSRLLDGEFVVSSEAGEGADWLADPLVAGAGWRCLVALPVLVAGQLVACLCLAGRGVRQVSSVTRGCLPELARHYTRTLERLGEQETAARLQQNLGCLFDALNDFLLVVDAAGTIIHHNRVVGERLGYAGHELLGQALLAVYPQKCREIAAEQLAEMLAGQRRQSTLPLSRSDGNEIAVETRMVRGDWDGLPVLFCVAQDITERLLAEERQRLAASVFEHAHEGIMITDPAGIIVEVNATFSELTGYSRAEAVGQSTALLKSGHHEAAFYADMWRVIQQAGYWHGEVWNRKKSGEIFVELLTVSAVYNGLGEITHFVGIFSDITLLKEHQSRLERLAHFDALTQLPNRMLLSDRLQLAMAQTVRNGDLLAVCYLDLDGFKPVNDEYGHAVGDRLLVEVAQRLKLCVRAGDTVARLGGDEFVLLFSALGDEHECDHAVGRIISALSSPFDMLGHSITISASVGVTLYPSDPSDADTLLRHADQAMYAAKQAGRNRYHLFDPESDRRARARREELARIRQALASGEFVLHYQPKVDMRQGLVLGVEALIRWQHPERGLLLPADFLPLIDGSDLAVELGNWVLAEALGQMESWGQAGLNLGVSINIAGEHLQAPGFADDLGRLLAKHPTVQPSAIELEVLETAALEDMVLVGEVFAACRQHGVHFALDDFGTGYSSLTYFRRLPAEVLKIDQSFVRDMLDDPEDLAIVEGVIGLTKAFRRKVIAEGVETPEHGMLLIQLGCDWAQGFGIARPMPAADIPAWVAGFRPDPLWSSIASFQWAREDLPMLLAEVDHGRWKKALYAYLADSSGVLVAPASDYRECRFGRWYYGVAQQRYAHLDAYAAIDDVHRRIHQLGSEMLALRARDDSGEAMAARRSELEALSAQLTDCVQGIQTEVLLAAGGL